MELKIAFLLSVGRKPLLLALLKHNYAVSPPVKLCNPKQTEKAETAILVFIVTQTKGIWGSLIPKQALLLLILSKVVDVQ